MPCVPPLTRLVMRLIVSSLTPWISMRLRGALGRSPNPIKGAPATGARESDNENLFRV